MHFLLQFLNIFFFIFHTGLTLFNLVGWIWQATRKFNLITITSTFGSWLLLGIWYGWGYCPCTDWHWEVRRALGYEVNTNSYIKFLIDSLTCIDITPNVAEGITVSGLILAFLASVILNARDQLLARKTGK